MYRWHPWRLIETARLCCSTCNAPEPATPRAPHRSSRCDRASSCTPDRNSHGRSCSDIDISEDGARVSRTEAVRRVQLSPEAPESLPSSQRSGCTRG
eukprot:661267-Hanusia_phi.AAC.4